MARRTTTRSVFSSFTSYSGEDYITAMRNFFLEKLPHESELADNFLNSHFSNVQVKKVDALNALNREANHTTQYDTSDVVLRRGGQFVVSVSLHGENQEDLRSKPITATATFKDDSKKLIKVPSAQEAEEDVEEDGFWASVEEVKDSVARITINIAHDAPVGRYKVELMLKCGYMKCKAEVAENVAILFNPFTDLDEVYMEDEASLNEFLLNESGFVYQSGQNGTVAPKAWAYDQFDKDVYEVVMNLLTSIPRTQRSSAIAISRAYSALVNSNDEGGVITGNWSGDFSGGIAPFKWNGSQAILSQYLKTGKPVNYGQCWVYAGTLTTVMRCIGIPCRPVTNYGSAHDTNGNKTIEFYYDGTKQLNSSDSIWNFHVWNEVWMKRSDLPAGRDGWQAIDATPQESSDGLMQMGPASLVSIQKGEVTNYDTKFVLAEVNADILYYHKKGNKFELTNVVTDGVGKQIVTKAIGSNNFEDITDQYKHKEGSVSERVTMLREVAKPDVSLAVKVADAKVGQSMKLNVQLSTAGGLNRSFSGQVTFFSRPYHGRSRVVLKDININGQLPYNQDFEVTADEYHQFLSQDAGFRFQAEVAVVIKETEQVIANETNFDLAIEPITVDVTTKKIKVNEPFNAVVKLKNPFDNKSLTNGTLTVESSKRFMDVVKIQVPEIKAGQVAQVPVSFNPKSNGAFHITFDMDFDQITDITTYLTVESQTGGQ